ncbi:hypothetical protein B4N89_37075 [Embleya scabrispora]|uniref:ATP-grasp domain-containing protein n=1 Tax=Embleya scabrispora TaxID=159449 RepID=A0A1T3NM26_9ACTN|nr:hypothetical protein [Embleya scabrispora]OPC77876.1 hypothetical protein B4N89_37075 [Embleya scabrispora]
MLRVALATCDLDEPDKDLPHTAAALERLGVQVVPVAWDAWVIWRRFDAVVLHSTWDYPLRYEEFLAWAARTTGAVRLFNPLAMVGWNSDKRYMSDLGRDGVPIVPGTWTYPGHPWAPPDAEEYVVKPSISCSARDTARYGPGPTEQARARAHVEALHRQGRTVLTQPYLRSVDAHGETSLMFLDGAYSHTVRRGAVLRVGAEIAEEGLFTTAAVEPRTPDPAELACAESVVRSVSRRFGTPLYVRVDLVRGPDDLPLLLECELIEPSLFLEHSRPAADRLASALVGRLEADARTCFSSPPRRTWRAPSR